MAHLRSSSSSSIARLSSYAGTAALAAGAVVAWARFVEPAWIQTTRTRVPWRGPRLRAVVLSDLHARPAGARRTARIVRRANALRPDLVLLPGDFVEGMDASAAKLAALRPLAGLRARLGAFAVLGNHDVDAEAISCCLHNAHIRVLENERVELDGFVVVGVGSVRRHDADPRAAFAGADPALPTMVVAHEHRALDLPAVRFDVAVTGHTHAGQGCVPFTGICPFLEPNMKPYRHGLYAHPRGGALYVSAGLGTSRVRARIGARAPRSPRSSSCLRDYCLSSHLLASMQSFAALHDAFAAHAWSDCCWHCVAPSRHCAHAWLGSPPAQ